MGKIEIKVTLMASLNKYFDGQKSRVISLPENSTMDELLNIIGLSETTITLVMINGKKAARDNILHQNDEITLYPHISGG